MERGYQFPEVTSWIRASKQDFQLVKDLGLRETGILVSCSDYHIFYTGSTGCTMPKLIPMVCVEVGKVSRLLSPSMFE